MAPDASGPLVSVVMPSYNQAGFIEESVASVLGQDYLRTELVVADGGSTDGTLEILRRIGQGDPRLRWFSRTDSGPAEAINRALARVRGTLIGWLNSDDLYTPGAIARAVEAFANNPAWLMLYGRGEHIDGNGLPLGPYPTLPPTTPAEHFARGCFICQPTVFFRATVPVLLGTLDTSLKASFDFDYWLRAFLAFPERIGFVDAVQARSRLHDQCITRKMRQRVALEGVEVVARHLGQAPIHWLVTYMEELVALPAEERGVRDIRQHLLDTLAQTKGKIGQSEYHQLKEQIAREPRFG